MLRSASTAIASTPRAPRLHAVQRRFSCANRYAATEEVDKWYVLLFNPFDYKYSSKVLPLACSTSFFSLALLSHPPALVLALLDPNAPLLTLFPLFLLLSSLFLAAPHLREEVPQSPAPVPVQRNEYFYGDSPQVPRVPINKPVHAGAWRGAEERWREGVRAGGRQRSLAL